MRVAIYARVSTRDKGQDTENQLLQVRQLCAAQGWPIVHEYVDHESGGKADRSQFQTMLRDAAMRQFDQVMFWALDRFSREGTLATLKCLKVLESYEVRWRSFTEPWIDSAGPFREVIISLLASLAKQERLRISERVRAGLERARKEGKQLGRRRKVFDRAKAARLRAEGVSWRWTRPRDDAGALRAGNWQRRSDLGDKKGAIYRPPAIAASSLPRLLGIGGLARYRVRLERARSLAPCCSGVQVGVLGGRDFVAQPQAQYPRQSGLVPVAPEVPGTHLGTPLHKVAPHPAPVVPAPYGQTQAVLEQR